MAHTEVRIIGQNGRTARVDEQGELVVGSGFFDETQFYELDLANTAYNFFPPKVRKKFIVTGIIMKADKQVSATVDAEVVIYTASAPDALTVDKVVIQSAMVEGDLLPLFPLNVEIPQGKYLNAKTTDDDIHMTIIGHYVPIVT